MGGSKKPLFDFKLEYLSYSTKYQNSFSRFWAICMKIIHAKFQPSSFKTEVGDRGDRQMNTWTSSIELARSEVEMGPDPTRAYFWPAVKKEANTPLTRVIFDQAQEIFFDPKLKNLMFLGKIFQTQTIDGWPYPTRATKNWPDLMRVKIFWLGSITTREGGIKCYWNIVKITFLFELRKAFLQFVTHLFFLIFLLPWLWHLLLSWIEWFCIWHRAFTFIEIINKEKSSYKWENKWTNIIFHEKSW